MYISTDELNVMLDYGMAVYRHFVPDIRPGKSIKSPIRTEHTPSFRIYYNNKDASWHYADFGMSGKSQEGDHWQFLKAKLNFDEATGGQGYKDAIAYAKEHILGITEGVFTKVMNPKLFEYKPPKPVKPVEISIVKRRWGTADLAYFNQSYITAKELDEVFTSCLKQALLTTYKDDPEGKSVLIRNSEKDPLYSWSFANYQRHKLYRPFHEDKRFKWMGNIKTDVDLFGGHLLPAQAEKGFIVAGNRDYMSFRAAISQDYAVTTLSGENARMSVQLYTYLKTIAPVWYSIMDDDFDHINKLTGLPDNTGEKAATNLYNNFGIIPANQPIIDAKANDLTKMLSIIKENNSRGLQELQDFYHSL